MYNHCYPANKQYQYKNHWNCDCESVPWRGLASSQRTFIRFAEVQTPDIESWYFGEFRWTSLIRNNATQGGKLFLFRGCSLFFSDFDGIEISWIVELRDGKSEIFFLLISLLSYYRKFSFDKKRDVFALKNRHSFLLVFVDQRYIQEKCKRFDTRILFPLAW